MTTRSRVGLRELANAVFLPADASTLTHVVQKTLDGGKVNEGLMHVILGAHTSGVRAISDLLDTAVDGRTVVRITTRDLRNLSPDLFAHNPRLLIIDVVEPKADIQWGVVKFILANEEFVLRSPGRWSVETVRPYTGAVICFSKKFPFESEEWSMIWRSKTYQAI